MSVESSAPRPARWWWIGGGVAALVVVVVVLVLALGGDDDPDAGASATPTVATADPSPSRTPDRPSASAEPTTDSSTSPATASPDPSGTAAAAPTVDPGAPEVPVPPLGDKDPVVGRGQDVVTAGGVDVRVVSVAATTTEAKGPGDVVGPGILVTLEVTNGGADALDAAGVAVAAFGGAEGTPLPPVDSDGRNEHLSGELAPGAKGSGVYVFMAPANGDALALQVLLGATFSPVVLQGVPIA